MENLKWIFEGIGTLIIGTIIGGAVGYKIGVKNSIKQNQKAGDNSSQSQVGSVTVIKNGGSDNGTKYSKPKSRR